jgi:hypothetical protein
VAISVASVNVILKLEVGSAGISMPDGFTLIGFLTDVCIALGGVLDIIKGTAMF